MKMTRSYQFLRRLTAWRDLYVDLRRQPFITLECEISIEEAKRRWIGFEVYAPLEVSIVTRT